ncbi:MAG: hypothetical protein P4M05_19625 [Bradyrhizobium sp.]|nr:hypothetical protein [Bradyrhizobium sp.]
MTLPADVRINIGAPFPARVLGNGVVVVEKANGIWTIKVDFTQLAQAPSLTSTQELLVFDPATGVYSLINVLAFVSASSGIYRSVAGGGNIIVLSTDRTILVSSGESAPTSIILPASSARQGSPLTVKDLQGNANSENITFVPYTGETIDGFSASASAANGVAVIDQNYGKKTLYPLTSGGWFL